MTLLGVQDDNGTYLVGGHMGRNQVVNVAGTKIIYSHRRSRTRDTITIKGPTDSFLRVMVSCFVHSFIHSFIHSFLPSLIHSFFIHSSFIHSFIHSSFIHSFNSFIHSFIQSFIHFSVSNLSALPFRNPRTL